MKTILDIPDELLAQLKARFARSTRFAASLLADALVGAGRVMHVG